MIQKKNIFLKQKKDMEQKGRKDKQTNAIKMGEKERKTDNKEK